MNSDLTLSGKRRSLLWSLGSLTSRPSHCHRHRTSWELGQKERKKRIKAGAGLSCLSDPRALFLLLQTKIKELFLELFLKAPVHGSGFPTAFGSKAGAGSWEHGCTQHGLRVLESWFPPLTSSHCLLFRLLREFNIQDVPLHSLRQDGIYGLSLGWRKIKKECLNHHEETSLVTESILKMSYLKFEKKS